MILFKNSFIHKLLALLMVFTTFSANAQTQKFPSSFTVAQDGSGDFKTIQEAINAVRDLSQQVVTINIKKGIYHEKLIVPGWKDNIVLKGEDPANTIITNADYSGKAYPGGKDQFGRDKYSTYTSFTLLVQGHDFRAENLTIENTSGRVGQAVALHVEGDRCIIRNCRLLGNQDTLFATNEGTRQFYDNCYIAGTTDFIFGEATAVFRNCTLQSLTNSYITAASTTQRQKFGFVFLDCKLRADKEATKVFLGRPWRPNAKTVFLNCDMESHIVPEGWNNWGNVENEKTVLYAEYKTTGSGNLTGRAKWGKQLTNKEAKTYTISNILAGADNWNPVDVK